MSTIDANLEQIIKDVLDENKNHQQNQSTAFTILCNKIINNIDNNEDSKKDITDGGEDCGIDAIHFDDDNKTCNIIQTKFYQNKDKSFDYNEINKTLNNAVNFCVSNDYEDQYNDRLKEKHKEYQEKQGDVITKVYFVINNIAKENKNVDTLIDKFNKKYSFIKAELIDGIELYNRFQKYLVPKVADFKYDLFFDNGENDSNEVSIIHHNVGGINTYSLIIQYSDFIDFLLAYEEKDNNNNIDGLFEKNIRNYFGIKKNSVNSEIMETLNNPDKRQYFCLLNNGITMICDKIEKKYNIGNNKIKLHIENPQIINGQQTTKTLFLAYKDKKIEQNKNFKIFVRLHEMSSDNDLVNSITTSTNNQSPIIKEDMMSNTKEIIELEKHFENLTNKTIKLIRKRDGNRVETSKEIRLGKALKLWYCIYNPIKAKNTKEGITKMVYYHLTDEEQKCDYMNDMQKFYDDVVFCSTLYFKIITKTTKSEEEKYKFIENSDEMLIYLINKEVENNSKIDKKTLIKNIDSDENILKIKEDALEKINNYLKPIDLSKTSYGYIFKNNKIFEALK